MIDKRRRAWFALAADKEEEAEEDEDEEEEAGAADGVSSSPRRRVDATGNRRLPPGGESPTFKPATPFAAVSSELFGDFFRKIDAPAVAAEDDAVGFSTPVPDARFGFKEEEPLVEVDEEDESPEARFGLRRPLLVREDMVGGVLMCWCLYVGVAVMDGLS